MRWLIAAGGTGGHVFPALSVAVVLRERVPLCEILFLGTRRGLEQKVIPDRGFSLRTLGVLGMVGLGWRAKIRAAAALPWTAVQCLSILAGFRPHLVLGMGGYASGPAVLLAALLGLPTAIAEQNAVAGRTNRLLGRFARKVFLAFPESGEDFPPGKIRVTGNPVRPELLREAHGTRPPHWDAREGRPLHLLVFGGSQGASGINRMVAEALPRLKSLPFPLHVIHQTGPQQLGEMRDAYDASGISCRVTGFIDRMGDAYRWAHLVVCRAGASSLAEIALFRRPSILVPFPHAADDHQMKNAQLFQSAGAGILLNERDATGEDFARILKELALDPRRLDSMGRSAGGLARPDASDQIVTECLRMLGKAGNPSPNGIAT